MFFASTVFLPQIHAFESFAEFMFALLQFAAISGQIIAAEADKVWHFALLR
jgi:hypothetical protein